MKMPAMDLFNVGSAPEIRALNYGGRTLERLGLSPIDIDSYELVERACEATGFEDFGQGLGAADFELPLQLLVDDYRQAAGLHLAGRLAARYDVLRLLGNRLRLVADRRRWPEIARERIERPVFIIGLPRTGTTLLHGLLAQDPDNRVPMGWEVMYPSPPPEHADYDTDQRITQAETRMRWLYRLAPEFRRIHAVGARLPQECIAIMAHAFCSYQFQTTHYVPGYQAWLDSQTLRDGYFMHRWVLQQLQWRCRGRRWVLKCPAHLFGLEALVATYPDAAVIHTHRDPAKVAGSLASLTTVLRRAFSDQVDPRAVAREMIPRWAQGVEMAVAARRRLPVPVLDVDYASLIRDPIAGVRRIYKFFDMPLSKRSVARMRDYLARSPKDKHGVHRYSLADFGLGRDQIERYFGRYREQFGIADES